VISTKNNFFFFLKKKKKKEKKLKITSIEGLLHAPTTKALLVLMQLATSAK